MLAGALVFAGLHRSRGRDRWCGPLVASGLALAFWSKPNAAVVVGSCVAAFLLAAGHANGKKTLAWSAAGALVGFVPYAPML